MTSRTERDSFGPIEVPAERLWGAQTQRSLAIFHISTERMPQEMILALAAVKRAAALVNRELGLLSEDKAAAIVQAADEVLVGQHDQEFLLSVWQTGSGTQSNMNMNEVLANRASELLGGRRGEAPGWCIPTTRSISASRPTTSFPPPCMWRRLPALPGNCCRRCACCARPGEKIRRVRRHRQDRPHPSAGCDAADARPGIFRLRRRNCSMRKR